MITPRISIQTRSLRSPLRAALPQAAAIGADGVEIDARNELQIADFSQTAMRQFKRLLEDHRLQVAAVAFPTRRGLDDPEDLERRLLALREAMEFAYRVGARVLTYRLGDALPEAAEEESESAQRATLLESLNVLALHGERVGARLAIASGTSPEAQDQLLRALPEATVGIDLDPALLISASHNPSEAAQRLGHAALHVRANDAVRETGGRAQETALGRGEADLPEVLAALEEHGYQGWLTAERREGSDPAGDLANAVAYLRAL